MQVQFLRLLFISNNNRFDSGCVTSLVLSVSVSACIVTTLLVCSADTDLDTVDADTILQDAVKAKDSNDTYSGTELNLWDRQRYFSRMEFMFLLLIKKLICF